MKLLLTIAFGALSIIVAAVPTQNDKSQFLPARNLNAVSTSVNGSCFPQETPTITRSSALPTCTRSSGPPGGGCDLTCIKYGCCTSIGCHCRAEVLAEFEQFEAAHELPHSNGSSNSSTSSSPPYCDETCVKYHCCDSTAGCHCLAEVLDELEKNEDLQGDVDAGMRNIQPADIDLGSEANANFFCGHPCGPAGSGCCFFRGTKSGPQCVCPTGVSPSLDKQLATAAEQLSPSEECSSDCENLYFIWRDCQMTQSSQECDKYICGLPSMDTCNYPMCQLYATCTSATTQTTSTSTTTQTKCTSTTTQSKNWA